MFSFTKRAVHKGYLSGWVQKVCILNGRREDKGRQTGREGQTSPYKFCKTSFVNSPKHVITLNLKPYNCNENKKKV
jgi:hypothetical protein